MPRPQLPPLPTGKAVPGAGWAEGTGVMPGGLEGGLQIISSSHSLPGRGLLRGLEP